MLDLREADRPRTMHLRRQGVWCQIPLAVRTEGRTLADQLKALLAIEGYANLLMGIFIAYLAWYYVARDESKAIDGLASAAAVIFGTVVLQFVAPDVNRWLYPVGLVLGWVGWACIRTLGGAGIGIAIAGLAADDQPPPSATPEARRWARLILQLIAGVVAVFGALSIIAYLLA